MKQIIGLIQFILGFVIGVLILAGGAVGAGYYFLSQMASAPPKPTFNQEKTTAKKPTENKQSNNIKTTKEIKETKEINNSKQTKETKEKKEEKLPQGAYHAKVTWSEGLMVRAEPSMSGSRTGGLKYNEKIIVLEVKDGWEKIRTASGVEGWVKSGNTNKVD